MKKRKQLVARLALAVVAALLFLQARAVVAQVKSARLLSAGDFTCPASGSTPLQVFPVRPTRQGYSLVNTGSVAVRIGYGTGTTNLSSSNAGQLPANATLSDGYPSVSVMEIRCQSTTGASVVLSGWEWGQ